MDIKEIKIPDIKCYKRNAKKHDEKQIEMIAESIKRFGFRQPIVLDANNEIVVGHGRYLAAKKIGLLTVPCEYADDLTDAEIKAYRLADNKLNESSWDFELVDEELTSLSVDFDMSEFGFDVHLDDINADADAGAGAEEDEAPETAEKRCESGDVWILGRWVYCKKCGKRHYIS